MVTRKDLENKILPEFVRVASSIGIDTTGWHLHNAYGNQFSIIGNNGLRVSPRSWVGTGNTMRGMEDMIRAWYLVPRG